MQTNTQVDRLLELANNYPSPHNGQPIRMRQFNDAEFELYFEKERGLQSTDISFIFSFVSMGVFMEHLSLSAAALGHELSYKLYLPKTGDLRGKGVVKFAQIKVQWSVNQEDGQLLKTLVDRQTSRKKYFAGVDNDTGVEIIKIAGDKGMRLARLSQDQAHQTIWLNQRAVFDDMFDDAVRKELDRWLRYSKRQKEATRDGLAYDCMQLNGAAMQMIVYHPGILRWPGVSGLLKAYYSRTMRDNSDVFYMLAPFASEQDSFNVGLVIMQIWKNLTGKGYYLHPFGTIMSNQAAHADFVKLAGIKNENRQESYLVFIFRAGKSEPPVPSLRIPYKEHLRME